MYFIMFQIATHKKNSMNCENQNDQVESLRNSLVKLNRYDDSRHTESMLLRFLKARKFDFKAAELMLTDFEQWRIDVNVQEIIESFSFPEDKEIMTFYPRYYHKTCKLGRPIYIEQFENFSTSRLLEITTEDRMLKKYIRQHEKLMYYRFPACSLKAGREIGQGVTIIDLKGAKLSEFYQGRSILTSVSDLGSRRYPETLGVLFIINAPSMFTWVWMLIGKILDPVTLSKIFVLGVDYQSTLLDHIDAENLQVRFGGKCIDPAGDFGPWNDGSVEGYPSGVWEEMRMRDGYTI